MTNLVPPYIISQLAAGCLRGQFHGAALFVDISGFTSITNALMEHGQHGAEVLAQVMRNIFEPMIECVYEQGGYIAYFAGDAITALFPEIPANTTAAQRALTAAWLVQEHVLTSAQHDTVYGPFTFSAKVGAASGPVEWGILRGGDGERAAYYFKGPAISGCAEAEKHAQAGDIILSPQFHSAVRGQVVVAAAGDHYRLTAAPPATHGERTTIQPEDSKGTALFLPRDLSTTQLGGEFRQVFNLFINIQGNPDHGAIADFMELTFSLQAKYGGSLNRIDFGDKGCHLLLFWGAPRSYENDAARALSFAMELRRQSSLMLRMGLTYRISHAGYIGSSLQAEYTCYGQGVNLAARLMSSAGWSEIWLDEDARDSASLLCEVEPLGALQFKGFASAQNVFRLEGWAPTAFTPIFGDALVGREQELARLAEAMQPLLQGRFAGVTTIIGEPGQGKSHLVSVFLELSAQPIGVAGLHIPGLQVFLCQTDEILRESLNPFRYWLKHYFAQSPAQSESAKKRAFDRRLNNVIENTPDRALAGELERSRSTLGALIDLHWPDSLYEKLSPELRFENSLNALRNLIRAESLRQPVILLLEDAHWLDLDSGTFLGRLSHNVAELPLALLVTSRVELDAGTIDPASPQHTIHLQSLGPEALATFVRRQLGQEPAADLLDFLAQRTNGNPLFVEQMLHHLSANDLLEQQPGQITLAKTEGIIIPDNVRSLLVARLDRLAPETRDLVQRAAVLGREFEQDVLARMAEQKETMPDLVRDAEQEEIWAPLHERRYIFRHALLRDAAYRMQVRSRRQDLHRQAAQAFEWWHEQDVTRAPRYAEIAYHFDRAEEVTEAIRYYGQAGEQAGEGYSNEDALTYFSRALELADPEEIEPQYDLLLGREGILQRTGQRERQEADLETLAGLATEATDPSREAAVLLRRSAYDLVMGRYEAAQLSAEKSVAQSVAAADKLAEAQAYHRWGRILWQQGHSQRAEPHLTKALALAKDVASPRVEAECLYEMGVIRYFQADYTDSRRYLMAAQASFVGLNDRQGEFQCISLRGAIAYASGNYGEMLATYHQALALCREIGWRYGEAWIMTQLGGSLFEVGAFEEAQEFHHSALEICREIGNSENEIDNLDTLGLIHHYRGEPDSALSCFEEALALEGTTRNARSRGFILTHLGYTLIELGELERANECLQEALAVRLQLGDEAAQKDVIAGMAKVAFTQNDLESAAQYASDISSWLESNGTDGVEFPVQLYLICFRIFCAQSDEDQTSAYAALQMLEAGHALLQERAASIDDSEQRLRFLENIPFNRELRDAWLARRKEG